MGRKIRTVVPQTKEQFKPNWPYLEEFEKTKKLYKQKQKGNFDKKRKARPLPPLDYGTSVWVNLQDRQVPGTISHSADTHRSYHVLIYHLVKFVVIEGIFNLVNNLEILQTVVQVQV